MFCYVISTSNSEDLQRLGEFVTSLQSSSQATEAANRFYRLCYVFHQVATLYVEANSRTKGTDGGLVTQLLPEDLELTDVPWSEFDQYLNALGFAPPKAIAPDGEPSTTAGSFDTISGFSPAPDPPGSLESWFQGNQYMMGLLEQDLSYLDHPTS